MKKLFAVLYNLIVAAFFLFSGVMMFIVNSSEESEFIRILMFILGAIVCYAGLVSLSIVFKKLKAFSKETVLSAAVATAFALKKDVPLVIFQLSLAITAIEDKFLSLETLLHVAGAVLGIIGIVCTISLLKNN